MIRDSFRRVGPWSFAWALVWLVLAGPAGAQTVTGTLQGTVTDSSGGVLPGVTVTIRNDDTGAGRDLVTNAVGFFGAPFLQVGSYTVTVKLDGFQTVIEQKVLVSLNQTRVMNFALKPAGVAEVVTVEGKAPIINSTNAEVKSVLTSQEITDKPALNPGSFLDLASIFPGFQENPTSGQNNPTASSGSSINFNGTGTRGATFQINGVNNDDSSENQNRQGASLSTIKEFQVISSTPSAEFGRGYGAVVLVQTKSGTNQLHGDAYWYLQDSQRLRALAKFATVKPSYQRNQYGGTAGFPIKKDRMFLFVSVDRTKYDGNNNYARDLFLPSEINSRWLTRGNDTPANRAWIQSILDRYPKDVAPNDPRSNRTYATVVGFNWPDQDYSARWDWQLGQDSIVTRYQYTAQLRENQEVILGEQTRQDNQQQNLGVTWTKVFRNNLVGEFRYGLGYRQTRVDIAAGNDTPIVRFTGSPVSGTIIGNAGNFPIHRNQTDHQFVYNLSWAWGRNHTFKAGTDIRRQQLDDLADNYSRGWWTFRTSCGGTTYPTPYAAMLDGCVNSFTRAWGPFYLENRINESNFYAEDQWRIGSLTAQLGVRYEYVSAPKEKEHRIDYGFGPDKNNVEPRVSAAWAIPSSKGFLRWLAGSQAGAASLRGGFARTDGRIFQSVFSQGGASVRTNPPDAIYSTFSTLPGILNVSDPTLGYVFTPGYPTTRYSIAIPDKNLEMPHTNAWSLSYERQIRWNSSIRVTYNGNHSSGMIRYEMGNLPQSPLAGPIVVANHPNNAPAPGWPDLRGKTINAIAKDLMCAGTGYLPGVNVNAACPSPVPIADNEISARVPRTNERRPDPRFITNSIIANDAEAWYEGVQFEWIKRMSNGVALSVNYTRSRSEDTTSEATFVGPGDSNQLGPDKRYAKGYGRFHTPHRLTINGSYVLPILRGSRGLAGTLLGGWQVSGVLKLASGNPFTIMQTSGLDLNFDGYSETRPVILDPSILGRSIDDPATSQQLLPASAFRPATLSDTLDMLVGRNTFFGDGLVNLDLGVYKAFRLGRGKSADFRVQIFNALNGVQYAFPATDPTLSTFGRITGTATGYIPRTVQLNVRFVF